MFYFRCIFYTFYTNTGKPMNRNIILKTFDEVRYFRKRLIFAIELKEKVTFLILSNEPIFDIENFRNYLIENELNQFAKNEINNLIELIDSFLNFKIKYEAVPKSENHFSYEYPKKGKGFGDGNLMYVLKVNDSFLKVNEATFSEKEPFYSRLTSLNYFNISNRLLDIKDLFTNFFEQPQQTNTIKTEIETKNILTNDTYYNILENCTIEAFESLKLKALYPKNGTKAIWDISSLTITKGDGLPTEKDNDLFRREYILDNMRVTFLMALDRFSKDFEIKHSITRDIFYKKCYQSILLKTSQSPLWNKPDFGFDINAEPCNLTFIWNMRTYIEARSKEYQQPEIPQKNKEIEQYLQSYKHSYFSSVIDKQNNNKQDNILFYGKVTADVLEQRNKDLLSNKILKERSKLLSNYNKRLYYLTGHTMQLFKAVNDYSNTTNSGYLTKIKINEDEVFISLNELKKITKSIKHNLLNEEIKTASKIRDYCILMFDDCIDLLKDSFGIDIYKSPLYSHFENVKKEFVNSINYAELKIINDLSKSTPEAPKQPETNKPKKPKKTLFQFINDIDNKEAFLQDLKKTFPTEIGKSIKAVIDILTKENILIYGTKEFKLMFEELENFFSRDLGTYNSVQNVKIVDEETTDIIYKKLNPLIMKHKTT